MRNLENEPTRAVTMSDVAKAAGVSRATVSFVLNDTAGQTIPDSTRERVRETASALGYRPHAIARALREGRSRLVVLEVGAVPQGPHLERFIDGLDRELSAAGHGLLVSVSRAQDRASAQLAIDALRPHAVLDLSTLYRGDAPLAPDDEWSIGLLAPLSAQIGYLAERGHDRIALAVPDAGTPFVERMTTHLHETAERAGVRVTRILPLGPTTDACARLRELRGTVTAVAALSDTLALTVLSAAADLGIPVPADLAVIGSGDAPEAALWRPALTSVAVDTFAHGIRTARQLLGLPVGDAAPTQARVVPRATA
ncbi:LacI family DNA-binding transcriptional regulator [Microbacterium sp. No. 7]|uniref:LacI family DNA-binding transcriptional regulator n=1 Tax=Microbacterium sp. No. 7 TaxID=1714373 RepID=UPI0006CF94D9|nr:LacI family DNA-binding transcriptional regulator [Microbacterium sp. No. 7]ALJ18677.1 hypothetical protein AOA12_01605 [Microbacterium sp. No. 7]